MRTRLMIGIVIIVIISLLGGIIYIYNRSDIKPNEMETIYNEKEVYTYISTTVDYMTFADEINVEGEVIVEKNKEYIQLFELDKKKKYEYSCKVGEEFAVGDCLYEQEGNRILAKNNLKLINIDDNEELVEFSFLNYDNLCIRTEVDYNNYKKIYGDVKVEILLDGEIYAGDISYIDCVMNNNKVEVLIDTQARFLPGMNVNVRLIYEENKEYLCIPSEFISVQGEKKYIQVNKGTELEPELEDKYVILGGKFEMTEEGNTYTYYEVLEGVQAKEEIYMRVRLGEKFE